MFVLVAASGLVVTAQVAPIAKDYKIAGLPVNFLFIGSTVIVMAGIVDNILNGLARPTFGWVSDHIGRENTMAIVFAVGAGAYWALGTIGNTPWTFIVDRRPGLLHLGRDLQPVPRDLHRHLRLEIRHDQCGPALHGQGHGVVPGAGRELAAELHRRLACGVRGGDDRQSGGGRHRALHRQADAGIEAGGRDAGVTCARDRMSGERRRISLIHAVHADRTYWNRFRPRRPRSFFPSRTFASPTAALRDQVLAV